MSTTEAAATARRAVALLLVCGLALTACGGAGDDGEAALVEETLAAAAHSDDPADCELLYTQAFLERMAAGFEGDAALRLCAEVVEEDRGEDPREVNVSAIWIDGGEATAEAAFVGGTLGGQAIAFELVEEEGEWKIDRMAEFVEFDRDRLLDGLKREVREADYSAFQAELGACMIERLEGLGDEELQDLALYNDPEGLRGILEACIRGAEGTQEL